ncbi:MAG TPA: hypothetical protein VFL69_14575 [Marmoricola sp.]|jgi:hypothetical protein|nr:hypothetical protein [Marmoricola sp.]
MFNDMGQIMGFLAACFVTMGAMLAMLTYAEASLDREEESSLLALLRRLREVRGDQQVATVEVTRERVETR